MKIKILLSLLLCSIVSIAYGQISIKQRDVEMKNLSHADSLHINEYIDKAYYYGIYHYKYQIYFDSILQISPTNAFYWQQKGMPLLKMKKYELGMKFTDSAVKYNPNYIDYKAFLECIYTKEYSESISDFIHAKKIKGELHIMDHSYDFYIGLCNLQLNQFDLADSMLQISISHCKRNKLPIHYLDYFYLGIVKMEKEDYNAAILCFKEVLKLYATLPEAKYYIGWCLESLKSINENEPNHDEEALNYYLDGFANYKEGYTINEDNAIYEDYPYTVKKRQFLYAIERLNVKKSH